MTDNAAPLAGVRIVELSAKGPAPFGVMLLADLGADVIRVDRPAAGDNPFDVDLVGRGRRSIAVNLKEPAGLDVVLRLVDTADVLVEGYRPGVTERLGLGPDTCLKQNRRLIYARMTGWGQVGPLAQQAAHDINYLAIAGALHPLGSADRPPPPPLNLVGDFAAGGAYLVIGILTALYERERSGLGQVIDVAMVDGIAGLLTAFHAMRSLGAWNDEREANIVDGGAPCYRTYATADGGYVAVGCLEPGFYSLFLQMLGLDPALWPQYDQRRWAAQRAELAQIFAAEPRLHWEQLFDGSDACVSPVLSLDESTRTPHLAAREAFEETAEGLVPRPAPRLSRTPPRRGGPAPRSGDQTDEILSELGFDGAARAELRQSGSVQ